MQYKVRSTTRGYHYVMVRDNDQAKWEYYRAGYGNELLRYTVQSSAEEAVRLLNLMYGDMPVLGHPRVNVRTTAEVSISQASPEVKAKLAETITFFTEHLNSHETLKICEWYHPFLQITVEDRTWKHYPCYARTMVSFDLSNGLVASDESANKAQFARKGWISRIRQLIGYEPTRYTDCGDKNKTTRC